MLCRLRALDDEAVAHVIVVVYRSTRFCQKESHLFGAERGAPYGHACQGVRVTYKT